MQTGENEQDLRKVLDLTRFGSVFMLLLHYYYYCYAAFHLWKWTASISDRILSNVEQTGLFSHFHTSKLIALGLLAVTLLGARGRKSEKVTTQLATVYLVAGLLLYFISMGILYIPSDIAIVAGLYMLTTSVGYLMIMAGGTFLSRIIFVRLDKDIFNELNESFPQMETKVENEFSINFPTEYTLKGKVRRGWISFPNPMRGLLVAGSPGSGKSYFIINSTIKMHLAKGFSMMVYDFKYDDLSIIAYNHFLKNRAKYKVPPSFYLVNFDDLSRCHRCNPLDPAGMTDITDAIESARTILLGLNKSWIQKTGDFFVESPINLLSAIIWFLRKYRDGEFCTLPHAIELLQLDMEQLFTVISQEPECSVLINPFISAFRTHTMEQLEGQVDGTKIALGRLSSPTIYYAMSGNDFTLDINNPAAPKIVCFANNPVKADIYGAVLSLYVSRLTKLVNQRGKLKSSLIFDEFPTLYFGGISTLLATARSNLVSTIVAIQDFSQLKQSYGRDQAEVIVNIMGNVISGQVAGDSAKQLSDRFGRINQDRQSLSINATDTSLNKSTQLDSAVPASTISSKLSSGEFVGIMADNPEEPIKLKTFHGKIINDHAAIAEERKKYKEIPPFNLIRDGEVRRIYQGIKQDIFMIVDDIMETLIAQEPPIIQKDQSQEEEGRDGENEPDQAIVENN